MAFEEPLLRSEKRMSQPTSVFGRFHGAGNLGTGLGLKSHGMEGFPKVGANVTPHTSGVTIGVKPLKSFADGGLNTMINPVPDVMNVYGQMPSDIPLNDTGSTAGIGIGGQSQQPMSPYGLGDLSNYQAPQQDPSIGQSYQGSLDITNPQQNGGWMENKQFGGITGRQYVNAGLTALTGVLANIANGKLTKSAGNITSNAQHNSNMGAAMPTHTSVRRASGGIIGYAQGGMVENCYAGGGSMVGPSDPVPAQPGQGQQNPIASQPDENNPASQMITANAIKAMLGQSQNPQADIQAFVQHFGSHALQALVQKVKESQQGGQGQAPQGVGIQQVQPQPQMQQGSPQVQGQGISAGMASGGLTGSRDSNGMLSGDGDGMSDGITANQGSVKVADGEFVLDGSTVSQIGNGSSQAGAKKITEAVKALRQKKFGSAKQPLMVKDEHNPVLKTLGQ